jgi:DNA-binding transcriptional ArsR family regulator
MLLLGQRPLTASDADHELFADRGPELQRVRRALDLGLNAYVHGSPGSGRTSFLRQVQRGKPEARYVRLHGFEALVERLDEIERTLEDKAVLERYGPAPLLEPLRAFSGKVVKVSSDPLRNLRKAVGPIGSGQRRIVLVDDLGHKECHELFGRLRDELWELPIQWVVTGSVASLDPPADTFFDAVVELSLLDHHGLRDLVRSRAASGTPEERDLLMSRADSVIDNVAPCTPRRALSVLRDLCLSDDLAEATGQLADLQSARSSLKPTANRLIDALIHYGPAHAGDTRLLEEVGVTRSRVVQLLAELQADGLVTAQREGRRKLFDVPAGRLVSADVLTEGRGEAQDEP